MTTVGTLAPDGDDRGNSDAEADGDDLLAGLTGDMPAMLPVTGAQPKRKSTGA